MRLVGVAIDVEVKLVLVVVWYSKGGGGGGGGGKGEGDHNLKKWWLLMDHRCGGGNDGPLEVLSMVE